MASRMYSVHHPRMEMVHWPLFSLRVRTTRVELRYPDDDDCRALADLGARGVHDPGWMPFSIPWTDVPPPLQQRNTLQHLWRLRVAWQPNDWSCPLAVVYEGEVVGVQDVLAKDFRVLRQVATGSWLGREHQGKGIGKEMRTAVLHLAFEGLGADRALSGAWEDNAPSLGVSRSLGYEPDGTRRALRRDQPSTLIGLRLTRERWLEHRRDDIEIIGLEPCREMFGIE